MVVFGVLVGWLDFCVLGRRFSSFADTFLVSGFSLTARRTASSVLFGIFSEILLSSDAFLVCFSQPGVRHLSEIFFSSDAFLVFLSQLGVRHLLGDFPVHLRLSHLGVRRTISTSDHRSSDLLLLLLLYDHPQVFLIVLLCFF